MNLKAKILILTVLAVLAILYAGNSVLAQPGGGLITVPNPLGNVRDIGGLLHRIAGFLFAIAAPILTIMVLWAGFQFLTSAGEPEKLATARKTLLWAVLGFAIVLINWGFAYIVREVLRGGQ